jgi:hypothetical protein
LTLFPGTSVVYRILTTFVIPTKRSNINVILVLEVLVMVAREVYINAKMSRHIYLNVESDFFP